MYDVYWLNCLAGHRFAERFGLLCAFDPERRPYLGAGSGVRRA